MTDKILVEVTGRVIEAGNMNEGRGVVLEVDGETVCYTGMTIEQAREVGGLLGAQLTITVRQTQSPLENYIGSLGGPNG